MPNPLFKPDTIGEVIAERKYSVSGSPLGIGKVIVSLGKPEKLPDSTGYYCPFQIIGLGPAKVRCAFGIDAFQAIQLAMTAIGAFLTSLNESEGNKLRWEGDDEGRLGFPLPE
jgi:hypothetical protein